MFSVSPEPNDVSEPARAFGQVEVCSRWDQLDPLRQEWDALARRSPTGEIFQTFDFLKTWHQSDTRTSRLSVMLVRSGGRLAGVAPMMTAARNIWGCRLRTLEFLGSPACDYADFLYDDPRVLELLWPAVWQLNRCTDLLYLQEIPERSPTRAFLKSRALEERKGEFCWSVALPPAEAPVSEYLKAPGFRPRVVRRLEKEGALSIDAYTRPAEIQEHLPIHFDQHVSRWRELGKTSCFTGSRHRGLYQNLARALGCSGAIVLHVMRLNGTPVASSLGFVHRRKLMIYTLAFEPAYRRFYCGLVFLVKLMQSLDRRDLDEVDFGRGSEPFKCYFSDRKELNVSFLATPTLKGRALMQAYLEARDWTMSHDGIKQLLLRCGYRGETVALDGQKGRG